MAVRQNELNLGGFGLVLSFVFVVVFVCFLSKSHQHTENPVNVF